MNAPNRKAPAFQFYARDFLAGRVATYSLEEIGAYILLLSYNWELKTLPTRRELLARLLRISPRKFDAIWATIGEQFVERDGSYVNPRLELERENQKAYSAAMSENGKLGGRPPKSRGLADEKPPKSTASASASASVSTSTPASPRKARGGDPKPGSSFRLAPYIDAHREAFPGSEPPAARYGKVFKRLEAKHGAEETLRRFRVCLAAKGTFGTPEELAAHWSEYGAVAEPKDPFAHLPGYPNVIDENGCFTVYGERATRPAGIL